MQARVVQHHDPRHLDHGNAPRKPSRSYRVHVRSAVNTSSRGERS
ncbi:MAG: hypothetical protein U0835_23340 [Isosphaeraceae bacterium]